MLSLLALLEHERRRRSLLPAQDSLSVESVFNLIRDMPYQRASTRIPEAIVQEWRGTCSGKHYFLDEIFRDLGLDSRIVMCTHLFTPNNTAHFPYELKNLIAGDSVPDVHTYLWVETPAGWMTVDATWPASAEPLGMPVNHTSTPGKDMAIACHPIEHYPVPEGQDPQAFKEQIIKEFCGANNQVRDQFIESMARWLSETT